MKNESGVDAQAGAKPPYVPFKSFSNLIASLRASGLPNRIDRSVLAGQSGALQSYLLSTFRFFGFISDNGTPTPLLKELVDNPKTEKAILAKAVKEKYDFIFDGKFNVLSATEAELLEKFREKGLGGETLRKCLSFFTMICEATDIKVSPHLKGKRGSNGSGATPKRKYTKRKQAPAVETAGGNAPQSNETLQDKLLAKFPAFDPKWDAEMQKKWFESFEKFMKAANPTASTPKDQEKTL